MERYHMTQTLLASYAYMFNCAEGYEEEAQEQFLKTLNREKTEQTDAMRNGIMFENLCYDMANGTYEPMGVTAMYYGACKVANIIKGAQIQVQVHRDIKVNGINFALCGVLDALKAGVIYDVKFLNKSMGGAELAGKYLESPQHPAYLYMVQGAYEFNYLVSDGNDLYIERYAREHTRPISEFIAEFMQGIESMGLMDVYKTKWLSKW